MCASYRDKERRQNFESFANKIYTGIRELNHDYAEKRAIWELFQNALDTVSEKGEIEIAKTEKGLLFKHNGRPFKDDEFGGLIKQYSVGKSYGDNEDKLGQYGTGFLSTHVYGKKIIINSSIQTDDGTYRMLKDFDLDRDIDLFDEKEKLNNLTKKLLSQDDILADLCDKGTALESAWLPFTTFEYVTGERGLEHIDRMLQYVKSIIPYIFCFNHKLQRVMVKTRSETVLYERKLTSSDAITITVNADDITIPVLSDMVNNVTVILGSSNLLVSDVPKQFLFYPLMETTDAGYNFIVHASNFKPNKERDYLHMDGGSEELKSDVQTNQSLLKSAFDLVKNKVSVDKTLLIMDLAKLQFTEKDSAFKKQLKADYIETIRHIKTADLMNAENSISQLRYFDESILLLDESKKKSVYEVVKQFVDVPAFEVYCELSRYINNWNAFLEIKFDTLALADIAKIIAENSDGNYLFIDDKKSYIDFVSEIATDIDLLNNIALIPNIHGDFRVFEHLVKWEHREESLIAIVDNVNAYISETYIHEDFEFIKNIKPYNREGFKKDFSQFCGDLIDDLSKENDNFSLSDIRFKRLVHTLTSFVSLNRKTKLNIETSAFYTRVFQVANNPDPLSDAVNMNYYPSIKLLAHLYIGHVQNTEIKENLSDLKEIISVMYDNINLREELLHKLACIPNQMHVLKPQSDLKRDDVKDPDFKNKWNEIVVGNIREELAEDGFEDFLQHSGNVNGLELGEAIEGKLNPEHRFISNDKTVTDHVLLLVEKISEQPDTWGKWLRNINLVKEEILMHQFQNEKTRSSLFSILTKSASTIELLGDLAKIENLEDLIKKGKERQKEDDRISKHRTYIQYIGTTIQNIIQAQLGAELANVISVLKSEENKELTTKEEQNGQDFIIYKNNLPVYYLEVKSKWDQNGRFALSKNQTEKCAAEKDKYAVISVNVDRYKKKHAINIDNIPFEDLYDFIRVNDNLGKDFEKLVLENVKKTELSDPKLIEYRGSIPQKIIDDDGVEFNTFINNLILKIKIA